MNTPLLVAGLVLLAVGLAVIVAGVEETVVEAPLSDYHMGLPAPTVTRKLSVVATVLGLPLAIIGVTLAITATATE